MNSPARAGARRLIMLESRTFITAMAPQATMVPGNSIVPGSAPRSSRPADSRASAPNSTCSSPSRRLSPAARPETAPKHSTGVAARIVTVADDRCSWLCSSGKTGGRLVMAARRLNPSAMIDTTSRAASSDRRPGSPAAGIFAINSQNYGSRSSLPVVRRAPRSSCARAASASGYVPPIRTSSTPSAIQPKRSPARHSSSSRSAM